MEVCLNYRKRTNPVRLVGLTGLAALAMISIGCGGRGPGQASNNKDIRLDAQPAKVRKRDPFIPAARPPAWDSPEGEFSFLKNRHPGKDVAVQPKSAPIPVQPKGEPTTTAWNNSVVIYRPSKSYEVRDHILQKGETLYGVARQYGISPKDLLNANSFSNPNHLPVGTIVRIPK